MSADFSNMTRNRCRVWIGLLMAAVVACVGPATGRLAASQADAAKASIREKLNRIGAEVFSRPDRTNESIRELKEILALDPNLAEAHLLLGIAYRTVGTPELMGEAKAEMVQALALNPGLVPARLYLANIYLDLGRPAKAHEELEAALAQSPGQPQFLALLGETERQLKNPGRAVELTRQALQSDESFAQARYYLALALFDLGRRDEAIQDLESIVRVGPKVVEPYLSLGTAYIEAGRTDAAVQALRQGIQIDPSRRDLHIQLARAYRSKGLLTEARAQLKLATPTGTPGPASTYGQQQVDSDFYLEKGSLELQQGRLEAAAVAFLKVLEMDPDQGPANRQLAEVYLLQGAYTKSSEYAARAEKLGFPLPEAKRKLLQEKRRTKEKMGPL
jgi:tetratricopeptide (TPR) repeat protein